MEKSIICATDFSPVSANASNYAADMAVMLGCDLLLFHAYSSPTPITDVPFPVFSSEDLRQEAEEKIRELAGQLRSRTNGKIAVGYLLREGDMVYRLNEHCSGNPPYTVVIGAESAGAVERFFGAGNAVHALNQVHWPLMIIPPLATFKNIRRVGLACDLEEVVHTLRAQELTGFIEDFKAELHVLHVTAGNNGPIDAASVEESAYLQELIGKLHPKYHFLHSERPEAAILDYAEKHRLDVLIIVPKKHSLFTKVFQHSHAKRFALHSQLPLLSLHE